MQNKPANNNFTTIIAWVFILLAGFAALGTLMQSLMLQFLYAKPEFATAMQSATKEMPPQSAFMLEHVRLVSWVAFAISATLLVSAFGMLRRNNLARRVFIGMMWLFAGATLAMSVVQLAYLDNLAAGSDLPQGFIKLMQATKIMSVIFGVGLGVLFGWLGWKLTAPAVITEFRPNRDTRIDE